MTRPKKVMKLTKLSSKNATLQIASSKAVSFKALTQDDAYANDQESLLESKHKSIIAPPDALSTEMFAKLKNEPAMTI